MRVALVAVFAMLGLTACAGGGGGGSSAPGTGIAPTAPGVSYTTIRNSPRETSYLTASVGLTTTSPALPGGQSSSYRPSIFGYYTVYDSPSTGEFGAVPGDKFGSNGTSTFTSANLDAAASNASTVAYTFALPNGSVSNVRLLNPAPGNPKIDLSYGSYGQWQSTTTLLGSVATQETWFVFGAITGDDIPHTGSATYRTAIDGHWVADGDLRTVVGSGTFSANFAAGTTQVSLDLNGVSTKTGQAFALGSFSGSGMIDPAYRAFSGELATTSGSSYKGEYGGFFFGPAAAEAGAVFGLTNGSGGVVNGVIMGKR